MLTLATGYEKRNSNWALARAQYDVAHGLKTQAELNVLLAFFLARNGKAYGFRYKDWSDYQLPFPANPPTLAATDQSVQFTTDGGVTTSFQLTKTYADAAGSYVRNITKPVAGTVLLWENGAPTSNFTVDTTTGIVTLTGPTASSNGYVISAQCQFDVPVRFDTDEMKATIHDYQNFTWGSIPLVEVRDI